jgi:hypothetical protein
MKSHTWLRKCPVLLQDNWTDNFDQGHVDVRDHTPTCNGTLDEGIHVTDHFANQVMLLVCS